MNPDTLFNHLVYVNSILEQARIKHWIMYGTLLGAVREHNIIAHDYDIDFGAYVEDVDKILELNKIIGQNGYKFGKAYTIGYSFKEPKNKKNIWRVSLKIAFHGEIVGDIYLYTPFEDGMMRRFDIVSGTYFWPKSTFPSWFIDKLIYVKIKNKLFSAPRDPEILLRHWYGPDWQTPIKAEAQGGTSRQNYDYYGGYKNLKLSFLIEYLEKVHGIIIRPSLYKQKISTYYPVNDRNWILENE